MHSSKVSLTAASVRSLMLQVQILLHRRYLLEVSQALAVPATVLRIRLVIGGVEDFRDLRKCRHGKLHG